MGNQAIWIIGHGSSKKEWVDHVEQLIHEVNSPFPMILSFLEKVEGRLIEDGINQLRILGAKDVFVIPLFVSSGSTHIEEIQTILSLYTEEFCFAFGSCMDNHPLVVKHILRQAEELSVNPEKESLLLIGHGSDKEDFFERWQGILESLVAELSKGSAYCHVDYATFLPNTITERLKENEQKAQPTTTICIPLFLSKGVFTDRKIPSLLQGYHVQYNGKAYLPNSWIAKWIQEQVDGLSSKNSKLEIR